MKMEYNGKHYTQVQIQALIHGGMARYSAFFFHVIEAPDCNTTDKTTYITLFTYMLSRKTRKGRGLNFAPLLLQ